jgi:5'-deoxynucleotidase YfbR-like HD superfamily hydrolase
LCSLKASPEAALYALLHDASEAYLGDITRPIKISPEMEFYWDAEETVQQGIYYCYGLDVLIPAWIADEVKQIDNRMLFTEKRDLLPHDLDWGYHIEPYPETIEPLPPKEAKLLFLKRFAELYNPTN